MTYENITLGADPEVFLYDPAQFQYHASCGLFGGTKEKPVPILGYPQSNMQEDNVALEFNIVPCLKKTEWMSRIQNTMEALQSLAMSKGLELTGTSCASFPASQLEHPAAKVFGCEPDYNAWTKEENPPLPPEIQNGALRSAGGHVHIGYKNPDLDSSIRLIKALDLFLGIPSILLDSRGMARRAIYGKAGAFRPKEYGVEYRTLSNFWCFDQKHMAYVWDQTQKAIRFLNKGGVIEEEDSEKIQQAVNKGDKILIGELTIKYPIFWSV